MRRRWIVIPVVGFGLIATAVGGHSAWIDRSLVAAFTAASGQGAEESSSSSPTVIQDYNRASSRGRDAANQWLDAEVENAAKRADLPRLLRLCNGQSAPLRSREEAALLTCRGLLIEARASEFRSIRAAWKGREKRTADWLCLDADFLLGEGRTSEASSLLEAMSFSGRDEAMRLGRLALTVDRPAVAAELLARAEALSPGNADIHESRGRLLQSEGRHDEAIIEFNAALIDHPNDWLLRDRLADSYRRRGNCAESVAALLPPGQPETADFAWIKAWFLNRVVCRVSRDWEADAPETGHLKRLAEYLLALPPDQFWISDSEQAHGSREPVTHRPETYWLKLLSLLKARREGEARCLIRIGSFREESWEPDLEDALERILDFRAGSAPGAVPVRKGTREHLFFRQLESLAAQGRLVRGGDDMPDDVAKILTSDAAIPAALIAAGWNEAALDMLCPGADLSRAPDWLAEGLARARRASRGSSAALRWVLHQPRSAALDLVAGELLVECGRGQEALERLRAAAADPATGGRAAWQYSLEALREGRPTDARRMLENNPHLTNTTEGQALLARCAAAEGNEDLAEQLYRDLAVDSSEARRYLARRALTGGDWGTAGRLTRSLFPDGGR
jgi:tetratricopeptide (TPR) repeat protein